MSLTPATVAIVAMVVAISGLWLTVLRDRRAMLTSRAERDSKVDLRLERLDTKMETVWGAFTAQLLTVLHHPDPLKIIPDALLRKYQASVTNVGTITQDELLQLVLLMQAVVLNENLSVDERGSAEQLLRLIRHHPMWSPTTNQAEELDSIIGRDMHPSAGGGVEMI